MSVTDLLHPEPVIAKPAHDARAPGGGSAWFPASTTAWTLQASGTAFVLGTPLTEGAPEPIASDYDDDEDEDYFYDDDDEDEDDLDDDFDDEEDDNDDEDEEEDDEI